MPKKVVKKSIKNIEEDLGEEISQEGVSTFKKPRKKQILIGLGVIAIFTAIFYFRGVFVAAVVNGQPISRLSLIQELEKQQGKEALEAIITETLIQQEAKKQNAEVSQDEIDEEITKLEESLKGQGQELNQLLAMQGLKKEDLLKQIRLQKLVEKILGDRINVSDKEVDEYLESNKDLLPEDSDPEEIKEQTRGQLRQQKISEEVQSWLEELKENAEINYFVQY